MIRPVAWQNKNTENTHTLHRRAVSTYIYTTWLVQVGTFYAVSKGKGEEFHMVRFLV